MLHAYLYATADRQFVGVNLGSKPVFRPGRKDAVGVLNGEESLVAEDVHEVSQLLLGHSGNHLIADQTDVLLMFVPSSDGMCTEESSADECGAIFADTPNDA